MVTMLVSTRSSCSMNLAAKCLYLMIIHLLQCSEEYGLFELSSELKLDRVDLPVSENILQVENILALPLITIFCK